MEVYQQKDESMHHNETPKEFIVDEQPIDVEKEEIIIQDEPSIEVQEKRPSFKCDPPSEAEKKEEVIQTTFQEFLERRRLAAQEKEQEIEDSDSEVQANRST